VIDSQRILVFVPNWVGDVVMATPALQSIRARFPNARIVHLMRSYVADVLRGTSFGNEVAFWSSGGPGGFARMIWELRRERFDMAVLLTNSFRSAMVAWMAGATERVGYVRDRRGPLLTKRLAPVRQGRRFVPLPALDYYNELAVAVGCGPPGLKMELATVPSDESEIDARLGDVDTRRPLVVLNPGANFGWAKCWPADYYAALADRLVEEYGARVIASLVPRERAIGDRLKAAARRPIEVFADPPLGIGPLKALIKRADLLVTNDTGPRHFAAAFGTPVVTIFGSSDPQWTDTRYARERIVRLHLECQPCMKRVCPLKHHNCMQHLLPDMVMEKIGELLGPGRALSRLNLAPVS
jgi:heptosyltransferase-2